jgi:hypothetical protein
MSVTKYLPLLIAWALLPFSTVAQQYSIVPNISAPDGSFLMPLAVSSDGQIIVYQIDQSLFFVNADGSSNTSIADAGGSGRLNVSLSEDGTQITYTDLDFPDSFFLYNTETATQEEFMVGGGGTPGQAVSGVSLSADGSFVVYSATNDPVGENPELDRQLFHITTDQTVWEQITNFQGWGVIQRPTLANAAESIVFSSSDDLTGNNSDSNVELFMINLDGSGLVQVTDDTTGVSNSRPSISSDGQTVLYQRYVQSSGSFAGQVMVTNSDGTEQQEIVSSPGGNGDKLLEVTNGMAGTGVRAVYTKHDEEFSSGESRYLFDPSSPSSAPEKIIPNAVGEPSRFTVESAAISRNGQYIVFYAVDGSAQAGDLGSLSGSLYLGYLDGSGGSSGSDAGTGTASSQTPEDLVGDGGGSGSLSKWGFIGLLVFLRSSWRRTRWKR